MNRHQEMTNELFSYTYILHILCAHSFNDHYTHWAGESCGVSVLKIAFLFDDFYENEQNKWFCCKNPEKLPKTYGKSII